MDIPLQGENFTWSHNRNLPSWSRIEKVLISPEWEDHFPNVVQSKLPRVLSIISTFFLIVAIFRGAEVILNLRTCG